MKEPNLKRISSGDENQFLSSDKKVKEFEEINKKHNNIVKKLQGKIDNNASMKSDDISSNINDYELALEKKISELKYPSRV